jgi:hypothetical protein
MNRTRVVAILAALLALAGVSGGQEPGPEARLAEAYVQEVVEGQVAEAAKVYLDLLGDDAVPPGVRAEARFRFAVCAVLLGRADEARAHLATLLADAEAPAALKARAQEYARTVDGLGVGSELTRKLESLVFDLGRVSPIHYQGVPPVYRDFEIIGPAAVPFLRKLLAHPDLELRRHAFRILLRMGADGMVEAFTPEIGVWAQMAEEAGQWLKGRPGQAAAFEKVLLALPDGEFTRAVGHADQFGPLTETFLRAVADRVPDSAPGLVDRLGSHEGEMALLIEWVRSDVDGLARGAARVLVDRLGRGTLGEVPPPELFPTALERLVEGFKVWRGAGGYLDPALSRWADAVPAAAVLDWLEAAFEQLRTEKDTDSRKLLGVAANTLLSKLEGRLEDPGDPARGAAILLRRAEEIDAFVRESVKHGYRPNEPDDPFVAGLALLMRALPETERREFARRVLCVEGRENAGRYAGIFAPFGEEDLPDLLALWPSLPRTVQSALLPKVFAGDPTTWEEGKARRFLAAVPDLMRPADAATRKILLETALSKLLYRLPVEEAATTLVRLRESTREFDAYQTFQRFVAKTSFPPFLPAAIPALLPLADDALRTDLLNVSLAWLEAARRGEIQVPEAVRDGLARVVLSSLPEIPVVIWWEEVNCDPVRFPPTEWVPRAWPPSELLGTKQKPPLGGDQLAIDRAAEQLAGREEVNASILVFIKRCASPGLATKLAEDLLRRGGRSLLEVHGYLGPLMRPEVVEEELGRILAGEAPDLELVAALTVDLGDRHPSERLFPAVRALLGSDDKDLLLTGIRLARRLGRPDLLPALATKLDSLDPEIRDEAKAATDAILELDRLRKQ